MNSIKDDHYYRIKEILRPHGPIPVRPSTWWAGVASGRFPAPMKLGPRVTAWKGADINALLGRQLPPADEGPEG